MFRPILIAAALGAAIPLAAGAQATIEVRDAYARSSGPSARIGAAFMLLHNMGDTDDRLVAARSPAAERVELHTHLEDAGGVMRMREIEGGIALPAGGQHMLARGGDHIMFLGLTGPFEQGATIPLTLIFEGAGEVAIEATVDQDRAPEGHGGMGHGMGH